MINFFWIASDGYIEEARRSAASVRTQHADAVCTLFLEGKQHISPVGFDEVVNMKPHKSNLWFLRSTYYFTHVVPEHYRPMEKLVYMDTDTYVCGPLDDLFEMLEVFDFAASHAPGRQTAKTKGVIPVSFPEFNIGVIAFVLFKPLLELFNTWYELYDANPKVYMNNDQAPLREAFWRHGGDVSFSTLPTEFNFRFGFGGQVRGPVRVLHGRSKNYEALAEKVNENPGAIRAWKVGELI